MAGRAKQKKSLFHRIKKLLLEDPPRKRKTTQSTRHRKIVRKPVARHRRLKKGELARYEANPIITPLPENGWEAWQTFNPGVILLDGRVHFLYRAIGHDGISRFGYAGSSDGFVVEERLPHPVFTHQVKHSSFSAFSYASGGSFGGAEDPRIVRVDDEDTLYMTYTACDGDLRVGLASIKADDFLNKRWNWKTPALISPPGETHKNWVLFPRKIRGAYAILHSLSPRVSIAYRKTLDFGEGEYIKSYHDGTVRKRDCWECWLRGAGAPPLETRYGWLLFYHALGENEPWKYKVGAMLLDWDDPEKVLVCARAPVLEPEESYEQNGFKPQIVYVSGAVVKDGELFVYYGSGDSSIAVAHANFEEFVNTLIKTGMPKLHARKLRGKPA